MAHHRARCLLALVLAFLSPIAAVGQSVAAGDRLFNAGSAAYQRGDPASAYTSLSAAAQQYKGAGDKRKLMAAELWTGAAAAGLGRPEEANQLYAQALALAEELRDKEWAGNIATALANLAASTGKGLEAAKWFNRAADAFRDFGDAARERASREYAAYLQALGGQYAEASAAFDASLRTAAGRPAAELAWLRSMHGMSAYFLDRFTEALTDYSEAVRILSSGPESVELVQALAWMGKILSETDGGDKALEPLTKSLEMARGLKDREDEARVTAYIGFHYGRSGDFAQGARFYEDSLKVAKEIGNAEFIVSANDSLAWLYQQAGDMARAAAAKLAQIQTVGESGGAEERARMWNDYGLLLHYAGRYAEAVTAYDRALAVWRTLDRPKDVSVVLLNQGVALDGAGRSDEASRAIEQSITLSLSLGESADVEEAAGYLAELYGRTHEREKLVALLQRLVSLYRNAGRTRELMFLYNEIGYTQYAAGRYQDAIDSYGRARELARSLSATRDEAIHVLNTGQAQAALSRFDQALSTYKTALALSEVAGAAATDVRASVMNSMGELYRAWGWYDQSLTWYRQAEELFKGLGDKEGLASVYNNTGQAVRGAGNPTAALQYYQKALELSTALGDEEARAIHLSNLGEAYRETGSLDRARELYGEALALDGRNRNLRGVAVRRNDIGLVLLAQGKAQESVPYFQEGLEYWRSVGDSSDEARALENLGDAYIGMDRYGESSGYLQQAVDILERLRLTAAGSVRREYLQSQVRTYRTLAFSHFLAGEIWKSLYALELSRSKYLLEQMGGSLEAASFDYGDFVTFQERLAPGQALLSVARLDKDSFQLAVVDEKGVASGVVLMDAGRLERIYSTYARQIERQTGGPNGDRLDGIATYYRYLLSRPVLAAADRDARDAISAFLYDLTIAGMEEQLKGITSLLIVPDGLLALVPFECLRDPRGKLLVERFDIGYAQSLVVALRTMERRHAADRRPLLAFGGAVYEAGGSTVQSAPAAPADLGGLQLEAQALIAAGSSTRGAYGRLGVGSWKNLPGTLEEVKLLGRIVEGATVRTGSEVTETLVKGLSQSGELAKYRVIHFATHGIVLPDMPDLSAVVLSQVGVSGNEDGYLTAAEIARLHLDADFVVLSACDTGLGKVYQGEGVVGLTQSFLVAGADSLLVSLWQVDDESTRLFMTGLYTLVAQGESYEHAANEMKRAFLKDPRYASPFYWAPFIFNGNIEAGR